MEWMRLKVENDILMSSLFESGFMGESENLRKAKADAQLVSQIQVAMEVSKKVLKASMTGLLKSQAENPSSRFFMPLDLSEIELTQLTDKKKRKMKDTDIESE